MLSNKGADLNQNQQKMKFSYDTTAILREAVDIGEMLRKVCGGRLKQ
jgi:hypothetical protein